jgi:hypothetical protein
MKKIIIEKSREFAKRFSEKLNRKISFYSKRQQKIVVVVFSFLFSVICFSIIVEAFSKKTVQRDVRLIPVTPAHIGKTNKEPFARITDSDYLKVEKFKDSICKKDSIKYALLLDSIKIFEKFYHAQAKK